MGSTRKRRFRLWTEGFKALGRFSEVVKTSGLETSLVELVKIRASQINGCAYCIDMHTKDARAEGETEQRLYALSAWRETDFYSGRERAALALTEEITLIADSDGLDAVLEDAGEHFSPEELGKLVYLIIEINAWNRLAITTGAPDPGSYERPE